MVGKSNEYRLSRFLFNFLSVRIREAYADIVINLVCCKMSKNYYIIDLDGNQVGPIELSNLSKYGITHETLVWCQGMPDWVEASKLPELAPILFNTTPPPRPRKSGNRDMPPTPGSRSSQSYQTMPVNNMYNTPSIKPESYFVWSILATVLCCVPFGIVSIVYASKVDKLWDDGRYAEAKAASDNARLWLIISAAGGLIAGFIAFIAALAG